MSEPYPRALRGFSGDDVAEGTPAPDTPSDPLAVARHGGSGTGTVVAAPDEPGPSTREAVTREQQPQRDDDGDVHRDVREDAEAEAQGEVVDGYVVDLACLRRYRRDEYTQRASMHTTECALMGHCIESGYGLVGDNNALVPLDTESTPHVVAALQAAGETGVRLRVRRVSVDGEMQTRSAEALSPAQ